KAIDLNEDNRVYAKNDPDFAPLHVEREFVDLVGLKLVYPVDRQAHEPSPKTSGHRLHWRRYGIVVSPERAQAQCSATFVCGGACREALDFAADGCRDRQR